MRGVTGDSDCAAADPQICDDFRAAVALGFEISFS